MTASALLFDFFLVILGVAIGIATVVFRTAPEARPGLDAEFTSEGLDLWEGFDR